MNKLWTVLSGLILFLSCGESIDPDRDSSTLPFAVDEIEMVATVDFSPLESTPREFQIGFPARLQAPQGLAVIRGNSGTGFTSLIIAERKFCYQGNAVSESTLGGNQYFLAFETDSFLDCSLGGIASFDPEVEVRSGDTLRLEIETPGCSIEFETCIFTQVRAEIDILETLP
ncbi:MAG: hypothetical protein KC478_03080 [Bacteriovoracaceae bacterium]|nr:hypothetical protein [Bacteriovoracaceae bacterium]